MLKTYFSGSAVSIYREGDNTIPIVLRAGAETYAEPGRPHQCVLCEGWKTSSRLRRLLL